MVREDVLLELNKLLSKLGCNLFFIIVFYSPCITGLLFYHFIPYTTQTDRRKLITAHLVHL